MDNLAQPTDQVLVTGSNGFIGGKVVETLLEYGFTKLRCLVRPTSRLAGLHNALAKYPAAQSVEIVAGDLLSRDDCRRVAESASIVYHLAAGSDKSFAGSFMSTALATRNLLDALLAHGQLKRFVHVSSFAVYSNQRLKRGALLDENCPLEDNAQERFDAYAFGKLKQEELVREYGRQRRLPYVMIRPGTVFGPGKRELTGRIGVDTFGFFIHVGGGNVLPLTFVDNCAEAIVLAGLRAGVDGEVFNVVDDESLTSRQFLRAYRQRTNSGPSVRVPYPVAYGLCRLWEWYSRTTNGQLPPVFNRRRCAAEWKGNRYTNEKLRQTLGWRPRVNLQQAMELYLAQFETARN
jgi:nucleoside-diphosphate-sugar epimerase